MCRSGWPFCLLLLLSLVRANGADAIRVGYVTPHEARLILGVNEPREVSLELETLDGSAPAQSSRLSLPESLQSTVIEGLTPDTRYRVRLRSADEGVAEIAATFATPPLPESNSANLLEFVVAAGSPGGARESDLDLAAAGLQAQSPNATIWLGGLFRPESGESSSAAWKRAAIHTLNDPRWIGQWARSAHFGVLGRGDFGNEPSALSRHTSHRGSVLEAFERAWPAPNRPLPQSPSAYAFRWGDVAGFALDGLSLADGIERSPAERTILGDAQRTWLLNALATSNARFNLIFCGRPLLPPSKDGFALQSFKEAARQFESTLVASGARGIVLVTAGGPIGELTRHVGEGAYPFHELSLGPIARPIREDASGERALNYFRVPGTLVREPHFARLEVSGSSEERVLRLTVCRLDGSELWSETLLARTLEP